MLTNNRMDQAGRRLRRVLPCCALALLTVACATAQGSAPPTQPQPPPPPPPLSLTVTPSQATPNPAAVGTQMTASLSATPNNAPESNKELTVTGPTWQWSPAVTVMESGDGKTFSPAPASDYSASVSGGGSSSATFNFTPKVAAYFTAQVSVSVTYQESTTDTPPKSLSPVSASGGAYVLGVGPASSSGGSGGGAGANPQASSAHTAGAAPAATTSAPPSPGDGDLIVGTILHIQRGGLDVTNQTITVCAGEGVSLTASQSPGNLDTFLGNSSTDDGSEYTWLPSGGNPTGPFSGSSSSGGPGSLYNYNQSLNGQSGLSGPTFHVYFAGSGSGSSSGSISLADSLISDGTATVNFNILEPTAQVTPNFGLTGIGNNYNPAISQGQTYLHAGDQKLDANKNYLAGFWANFTQLAPPVSVTGSFEWVQLATKVLEQVNVPGAGWYAASAVPQNGYPGLVDGTYPYAAPISQGDFNVGQNFAAADSPGVPLEATAAGDLVQDLEGSADFEFTDWLMFEPTSYNGNNVTDATYIPVGKLSWKWVVDVKSNNGQWPIGNNLPNPQLTAGFSPTSSFPSWGDNLANYIGDLQPEAGKQ